MNAHRWFPIVLVLAVVPGRLSAQSDAQQVWDRLQGHYRAIAATSPDWFLRNYVLGKLQNRRIESWTFSFDRGVEYIIAGACDEDCKDVDIVIKDEDNKVVQRDDPARETPVLTFRPMRDGRYTVEITMTRCQEGPCYFGFGIFTK